MRIRWKNQGVNTCCWNMLLQIHWHRHSSCLLDRESNSMQKPLHPQHAQEHTRMLLTRRPLLSVREMSRSSMQSGWCRWHMFPQGTLNTKNSQKHSDTVQQHTQSTTSLPLSARTHSWATQSPTEASHSVWVALTPPGAPSSALRIVSTRRAALPRVRIHLARLTSLRARLSYGAAQL